MSVRVTLQRRRHQLTQFEHVHGSSRAEPRDVGALGAESREDKWRRWKIMAGALILLATVVVLIALSLSAPYFAENVVPMS